MKLLFAALAVFSAGALACPADEAMDAQADAQAKPVAQVKAPVKTSAAPAKAVASKKAQPTKVGKAATETASKL